MGYKRKEYVYMPLYFKWEQVLFADVIPAQSTVNILRAALRYAEHGTEPDNLTDMEMALFAAMRPEIDSSIERFENKREQTTDAANARWNKERDGMRTHADGCERMQTDADACDSMQTYAKVCNININKNKNIKDKYTERILLPLKDGSEWELPETARAEIIDGYPDADIDSVLRTARDWLIDNPNKRRSAAEMPKLIQTFLENRHSRPKPKNAWQNIEQHHYTDADIEAIERAAATDLCNRLYDG